MKCVAYIWSLGSWGYSKVVAFKVPCTVACIGGEGDTITSISLVTKKVCLCVVCMYVCLHRRVLTKTGVSLSLKL
jgi:hypothetical protein